MFSFLFDLGNLRLCTLLSIVIMLPMFSGYGDKTNSLEILSVCVVVCLLCVDKFVGQIHAYSRNAYLLRLFGCWTGISVIVAVSQIKQFPTLPVENTEIITFINLNDMYNCLQNEMGIVLKSVCIGLGYIRSKFGTMKPLIYIVYATVNAFLLLYVLDVVGNRFVLYFQQGFVREENFKTFYMSESINERSPLPLTFVETSRTDNILPCDFGVYREDYIRHIGEDVQLHCNFFIRKPALAHTVDVYWMKNGKRIYKTSDRVQDEFKWEDLHNLIRIKYTLTIRFIENEEFGAYKCVFETYSGLLLPEKPIVYSSFEFWIKCYITKQFIFRAANRVENIEVPVGNILDMKTFFYISVASDEISYEYTINAKDIHDVCLPEFQSCTLPVMLYALWKYGGHSVYKLMGHKIEIGELAASYLLVHTCACGRLYGAHSLTMYIPYFNSTTNREEIVEIVHEKNIFVGPTAQWWRNNSLKYDNLSSEIENSQIKQHVIELIGVIQEMDLFILNITYNCITLFIVLFIIRYFTYPAEIYYKVTVLPVKNLIFFGEFFHRIELSQITINKLAEIEESDLIKYDVYVSHSTEDYDWSKNVILPFLEKDCDITVCFPERDLVHEAGKTKLFIYSKATQACAKFIVVLSQSYIDEDDCNKFQLSTCILPLINSSNGRDIIFIKRTCGITIPVQLKWNMGVRTIDWTCNNDDNEKKFQLKRLLSSS